MLESGVGMRYWWVNQNQTFRQEIAGGYLWSPKRNANGGRNPFYESMREVAPGDLIFSFVDTRIAAIGIAKSYCWECPKPTEFGSTGQNWENIGWRVNVSFVSLLNKIRPKDHMDVLKSVLPQRYSPLQANGNGIQSIYLTELSASFAQVLGGLIGNEVRPLLAGDVVDAPVEDGKIVTGDDLDVWERRLEEQVESDVSVPDTDREAIVRARVGQGLFKQRVMQIETSCRITGVDNFRRSGAPGEIRTPDPLFRRYAVPNSKCRCWCRLRGSASFISLLNWTEVGLKTHGIISFLHSIPALHNSRLARAPIPRLARRRTSSFQRKFRCARPLQRGYLRTAYSGPGHSVGPR